MKRNRSSSVTFSLKLVITLGLLVYLLSKVEIGYVLTQIRAIDPASVIGAAIMVFLQLVLGSLRWRLINGLLGARQGPRQAFRITLIGHFFNQVLPSALGGDVVRAWLASRGDVALGHAIRGVVCDRMVGMVALVIMISGTLFILPDIAANQLILRSVFHTTAILGMGGLAALFFFGEPISRRLMTRGLLIEPVGRLVQDLRRALYSPATSASTLALSGAAHVLAVGAIFLCAKGMRIHLDFSAALTVVPTIMLVSMTPISIAGWGVREGATVVGLGLVGITAPDALAVSVTFGLVQIFVGLPGGALWFASRSNGESKGHSE